MVDINGVVLEKQSFEDLTLKLKKYGFYKVCATVELENEIPGVGKRITNILYKTDDRDDAYKNYSKIKEFIENGDYCLMINHTKGYFELLVPSKAEILKLAGKLVREGFTFEEWKKRLERYKKLENDLGVKLYYNVPLNYHTSYDFAPIN